MTVRVCPQHLRLMAVNLPNRIMLKEYRGTSLYIVPAKSCDTCNGKETRPRFKK